VARCPKGRQADQGAVVVKALERVAAQAPPLPSRVYEDFESRAADALVELAGISVGRDSDADRATVVVHVDRGLGQGQPAPVHPRISRSLARSAWVPASFDESLSARVLRNSYGSSLKS
jgi:hypothetical protein